MDLKSKIKVSILIPHPSNNYYFDDMSGDTWDALLQSISTSGIINAITVTDKNVIISGHQRVRACKVLGIEEIDCRVISYSDEDYKNQKDVKDLIESNLRQRVIGNANPIKTGKCFQFLNDWYGYVHGSTIFQGNQYNEASGKVFQTPDSEVPHHNQKEMAESYGITQRTMNNYMRMAQAIPELEELVDTGIVTKTTALAMMKELSPDEQAELISSLDTTKRITQREVQKYIDEIKQLKQQLSSTPVEVQIVDNTDYKRIEQLEQDCQAARENYENMTRQFQDKTQENQELRKKIEQLETDTPEAQFEKRLKDSTLLFCSKVATFIEQVGGFIWLTDKINQLPELEREGYIRAVHTIKSWADTMEYNINSKVKEIN